MQLVITMDITAGWQLPEMEGDDMSTKNDKGTKPEKKILPPALALLAGFTISFIAVITTSAAARLVSKGTIRIENAGELLLITAQDFTTLSDAIKDASVKANARALEQIVGSIEPLSNGSAEDGKYAWKLDGSGEPRIYRYSEVAGDYLIIGGWTNAIDYVANQLTEAEEEKEKSKERLAEAIKLADSDVEVLDSSYNGIKASLKELADERYKDGAANVYYGSAVASDVAAGVTFLNASGDMTGTLNTITSLASTTPLKAGESLNIAEGYYPKSLVVKTQTLASQTEANLAPGVMMNGASAWANGNLVSGNIATGTNPNYKIRTTSTEKVISGAAYYPGGITVDASDVYNKGKDAGKVDGERDGYDDGYEEYKLPRTIYYGGAKSETDWIQDGMEQVYDEYTGSYWWDVHPTTGRGNNVNVETSPQTLIPGAYITAPVKTRTSSLGNVSIDDPVLTIRVEIKNAEGQVVASSNSDTVKIPDGVTRGGVCVFFYVEAESAASDPPGGNAHVEAVLGDVYMHY